MWGNLPVGGGTDLLPAPTILHTKGDSKAFAPLDRFAKARRFRGWPLAPLLNLFGGRRGGGLRARGGWRLKPGKLGKI